MQRADRRFVWLGYGCAILALFFDGARGGFLIAIALGIAGLAIGITTLARRRPLNGAAIIVMSIVFAYLGATGFRQAFIGGLGQGFEAGQQAGQQWGQRLRQ